MAKQQLVSSRNVGLALALLALVLGCGGANHPIVKVEGKILFADGKTLPAGTRLVFNPGEPGRKAAKGVTTEDGSFQLTHTSGSAGAEVGKYTILLAAPEGADTGSFFKMVPKEYLDGSALSAEVKEGMTPLELKLSKR